MSLDRKINIAYISRTSNLTGAEKITLDIVKSLDKKSFRPIVFLPDRDGIFYSELISFGIDARIVKTPFLRVTYNPISLVNFAIKIISLNITFKKIFNIDNIDIVSCNTVHEALFVFMAARLTKTKLVICFKNILDKKWKKIIRAKFCNMFADKIIAVSRKAEMDYTEFVPAKNKKSGISVVINDCIDYEDYLNGFIPAELDYDGKSKDDFVIINIGSIQELKGQMLLLRAINHPIFEGLNIKIIFIGDIYHKSDLAYKAEIVDYINENKLNDKVIMAGYQKDVRNHLYNCDLLVHCPVIDDAFPRVILEAFCFEKIIVATKTGGIPEMINDGFNGFLSEVNETSLREKIFFVYSNKKNLEHIKKNALDTVKNKFSLKNQVKETENIYLEILKNR